VSISKIRKSRAEAPLIVSKSRRTRRRRVEAAMLRRHPLRANAIELPRRQFLHLAGGLPHSRPSRASRGRKPIRSSRCASSSASLLVDRKTQLRA
jgi:hypothetical protein